MHGAQHEVVIVEDNPGDVVLIRSALEEHGLGFQPMVFSNGEDAIEYVHGLSRCDSDLPYLVILDLNLPRRDGLEVLRALRAAPTHRPIAVAVLTTSDSPVERSEAEAIGIEAYLRKPLGFEAFLALGAVFRDLLLQFRGER